MKPLLVATCILLFPFSMGVFAQSLGLSNEQVIMEVRPLIIQPNQSVSIKLVSYNTDINRAEVSFFVDNVLLEQGLGLKSFVVEAPRVGERREVRLLIRTINQGTVEKILDLVPAGVDLVYEATNSYAPVMYRGKRLPAHEGGVRVVAIPYFLNEQGQKLDPKTLIYTWEVDNRVVVDASGYGRNVFEFLGSPYYSIRTISVTVESVDQTLIASRVIDLPAFDPVARFYVEHPLWGTDLSRAIVAEEPFLLRVPEMVVRAVPFFISDQDSLSRVTYEWRMNGEILSTFGDRNIINLRAPDEGEGRSVINLKISHNERILQIAQSLFTVIFGSESVRQAQVERGLDDPASPNLFGLPN